ncbi:MAG: hypothetical protein OXF27_07580 [Acidobacteria bacterium]|nr:hypothetical protein [Acidobacteriota bacterium]
MTNRPGRYVTNKPGHYLPDDDGYCQGCGQIPALVNWHLDHLHDAPGRPSPDPEKMRTISRNKMVACLACAIAALDDLADLHAVLGIEVAA